MTAFDRPTPFTTFGKRDVTNVPAQSLFLMNDPFVAEQAGLMANELLENKQLSENEKIVEAYLRAFSRPPTENEINKGLAFLKETKAVASIEPEDEENVDLTVWKEYCHALFNMKSFIYLL